jgi:uncharacterized protein
VDYYTQISLLILGDFLSILFEALPFIIIGAIIAGFLEELVPQRFFERVIPRNRFLAISLSALLGLVFPMCECGIVPVMRRLLRKGLPLSCCVAYMLAGPIINVVVIGSTVAAFASHNYGWWIIGLRVGLGFLVAVGAALVVEWQWKKHGDTLLKPEARPPKAKTADDENGDGPSIAPRSIWKRLGAISETALHDFIDITLFLILGAMVAAVVGALIQKQTIATLSAEYPALAILAMMALAIVLCLCSEADAFVAASFVTMHPSAKIAFLVLGPMMDFKLFLMYTRVFSFRLIWTIIGVVVVQVFVYSMVVHYLFYFFAPAAVPPPPLTP